MLLGGVSHPPWRQRWTHQHSKDVGYQLDWITKAAEGAQQLQSQVGE